MREQRVALALRRPGPASRKSAVVSFKAAGAAASAGVAACARPCTWATRALTAGSPLWSSDRVGGACSRVACTLAPWTANGESACASGWNPFARFPRTGSNAAAAPWLEEINARIAPGRALIAAETDPTLERNPGRVPSTLLMAWPWPATPVPSSPRSSLVRVRVSGSNVART